MTPTGRVGVVHVHSDYSHDGRDSLDRIRALAASRSVSFVAMSDHAEDFDAARFATYLAACSAASDETVRVIPGLEFRFAGFRGLHLIALGLHEWIAPTTPAEFAAIAPGVCECTMVAHPGLAGYLLPPEVAARIDAIEVWNGAYNTRYLPDPRALALLRALRQSRPEVIGVAGLDQHDGANDRATRVVLSDASTEPLAELRDGRFQNRGVTLSFGPYGDWSLAARAALTVARRGFDVVERTQQRWALRRRKRSIGRA